MDDSRTTSRFSLRFLIAAFATMLLAPSCATIVRGTRETVQVATRPEQSTVLYGTGRLRDGQSVTVKKGPEPPRFTIDPRQPLHQRMSYQPDPWLLGDAALLLAGILPGLVAFGVDLATGAWRDLDDTQVVFVPVEQTEAASVPPPH